MEATEIFRSGRAAVKPAGLSREARRFSIRSSALTAVVKASVCDPARLNMGDDLLSKL